MLIAIRDGMAEEWLDLESTVLVRHLDTQGETYRRLGFEPLANLDHACRELAAGRVFMGFNRGDDAGHLRAIHDAVDDADVVILGGGEVFLDISYAPLRGWVAYYEAIVQLCRWLGKPVVLTGASMPRLFDHACSDGVKRVLDNCSAVVLRDNLSAAMAALGGYGGPVKVLPDPAFGLANVGNSLLPHNDLVPPYIGFALRWIYWRSDEQYEQHIAQWAHVADTVAEKLGATPVFIPHNLYPVDDRRLDDRELAKDIMALMSYPAISIAHYDDPRDVFATYHDLDLVVAMRHHGAVLGLHANVPTVAFPYSDKTTALMSEAGQSHWIYTPGADVTELIIERYADSTPVDIAKYRDRWYGYMEVIHAAL